MAKRLFSEYQGTLQVDGYSAYNILQKREGVSRIGCNMHGRRKFYTAWKTDSKIGQSLAADALGFYKRLYLLEEKAREKNLTFRERHKMCTQKALPICTEFKAWAETNSPKVPPKSKRGEAFHDFLGEYPYLIGYLREGSLEMEMALLKEQSNILQLGETIGFFLIPKTVPMPVVFFRALASPRT